MTNIATSLSNSVIARRIYRSKAAEKGIHETDKYYLLATIKNNTVSIFKDETSDAMLGAAARLLQNNTTGGFVLTNGVKAAFLGETNSFFGSQAGAGITVGSYNTVIGARALAASEGAAYDRPPQIGSITEKGATVW